MRPQIRMLVRGRGGLPGISLGHRRRDGLGIGLGTHLGGSLFLICSMANWHSDCTRMA